MATRNKEVEQSLIRMIAYHLQAEMGGEDAVKVTPIEDFSPILTIHAGGTQIMTIMVSAYNNLDDYDPMQLYVDHLQEVNP